MSGKIIIKKIDAAKTQLETSDKSICKIAKDVGFDDTNYFTRIFKKTVGVTPSKYKKEKKNNYK
ncbi:MAG: helix-turn-helix domain-containing protein [Clostridia bacterium]|nr:helix-turn-helix domain-containing protein [Clostridia bacterium]